MNKAKEMFEELGYEFSNLYDDFGKIVYLKNQKSKIETSYFSEKKSFTFMNGKCIKKIFHPYYEYNGNNVEVTKEEHKAIHQQLLELGWLDE